MEENEEKSGKRPLLIVGSIVILALIIAGLFLPPISLGKRFGQTEENPDTTTATTDTENTSPETVSETAEEASALPEGVTLALTGGQSPQINRVAPAEFQSANATAANLPINRTLVGDIYTVSYDGDAPTGQVALAIPADGGDDKTLDLFGWSGTAWEFIPSQLDTNSRQIVAGEGRLLPALAMMQSEEPEAPAIAANILPDQSLPAPLLPLLTDITVGSLTLNEDGILDDNLSELPTGPYSQWLHVTNVADQEALLKLLESSPLQDAQISTIVQRVVADELSGVNLDYQDVPAAQSATFTEFVTKLAAALHAEELSLMLTLGTPTVSGTSWDTAGQDWVTLGDMADVVQVQLPVDPTAYADDGEAEQMLNWATRQIDRSKLNVLLSAQAVEQIGESVTAMSNADALVNFGELEFVQGSSEVEPNANIEVALSGTASPLEWDGASLTYKYGYEKGGQAYTVWLGNDAALAYRARIAKRYHVNGISVQGLDTVSEGANYVAVLDNYLGNGESPQPSGAAIVWTVQGTDAGVLASATGSDLTFSWEPNDNLGEFVISAEFALGEDVAPLGTLDLTVAEAQTEEETVTEEPADEATDTDEPTPAPTIDLGDADAVINVGANIRLGPGLTYGTIAGGAEAGTQIQVIGRNSDASWFNIILPDGQEGWIFASLITLNSTVDVSGLEVVEVAPPSSGSGSGDSGGNPPAPVPVPPVVSNTTFELGGQSQSFSNPTLMSYAGMNWIKFQHKFNSGDNPNDLAGRIQQAHANGYKVLLSIPGTPYPSSIDFAGYVSFVGGVAALGPDAIEIWNEENIDFEWPNGQIDPVSYVNNMLAPAYNSIKSANSNVMVISGALAPTGFFGGGCGAGGCDDDAYLAGMAAAGAANYLDCVGVHYNAGATAPSQSSGHPAGGTHYSWYFQPMMDVYSVLGKPLCFTELGYLSGDDYGGVPGRFSWAGNTSVAEHAQWLAEAVSLAANSGRVRMAIIFNVDFTQWGDDPQAGYAMIRADGGCPACDTLRAVMGQ